MPANKNAMTRYMILDELLSNRYHNYSLYDLTDEVSKRLSELYSDTKGVVRRTIEKDINYLEYEGPFMVDIERYWVSCINRETGKTTQKKCLRYKDPSFSIFRKALSDDEKYLLKEAFSLLGQFDGLPNLEALEALRQSLEFPEDEQRPIISFTKNPLENSNLLGELFVSISQKQVIELNYHTFANPKNTKSIVLHPYLLKEYNRRWFVIGAADSDGKILNFSLHRIDKVIPQPSLTYTTCPVDLAERFEDIIGVTFVEESPVHKIIFWASDNTKDYIKTKPLHESQRNMLDNLHNEYPALSGGAFFRIDCKKNYELIRELSSFGKDLIVLSPNDIRDEIIHRSEDMAAAYNSLRTKSS